MNISDPTETDAFLDALHLNGGDLDAVAKTVNNPVDVCKADLIELRKEYKKHEVQHKKQILGTGGGPPSDSENPLIKLKTLIELQVDGLYTIYDGDTDLMESFQLTQPEEKRIIPIELVTTLSPLDNTQPIPETNDNIDAPSTSMSGCPLTNRRDILKKKRDAALISSKINKPSKKSCNESFQSLAEAKSELISLQKELVSIEIEHKKKMPELELQDAMKENEFREAVRNKKLLLMDLEIKNTM